MGFEPTIPVIPVFERAKRVHALASAATVINNHIEQLFRSILTHSTYFIKITVNITILRICIT
jgi:hypothetical protein